MAEQQYIKIRRANEHNLKDLSVDIPRNKLVVLTGFGLYTALKNLFYNLPLIYENSIGPAISEFTLRLQQAIYGTNSEFCGIFNDTTAAFFENSQPQ